MSKYKVFNLHFEKEIDDIKSLQDEDFSKSEIDIFKTFKNQLFNSKVKCKKCKRALKVSLLTDTMGCSYCYSMILNKINNYKFKPTLIHSKALEFFLNISKNYRYKGKRPEYTKKYFDEQLKISDLKKELDYCIKIENYDKCEVLKQIIEQINSEQDKFRRKIDE